MATTYKELYSKVLSRLDRADGKALLASMDAVNDAHKVIARVRDFDDLKVLDKTGANTVDGQESYHLVNDWGLTRPKDLLSIRLMSASNSRKLVYLPHTQKDAWLPYPEDSGESKSGEYTQRGMSVELTPIPDAAYDCYVYYTQWPLILSADTDLSSYANANIDDVIIQLASSMAQAYLDNTHADWDALASSLLTGAIREESARPDRTLVAQAFDPGSNVILGEHWLKPFVLKDP